MSFLALAKRTLRYELNEEYEQSPETQQRCGVGGGRVSEVAYELTLYSGAARGLFRSGQDGETRAAPDNASNSFNSYADAHEQAQVARLCSAAERAVASLDAQADEAEIMLHGGPLP